MIRSSRYNLICWDAYDKGTGNLAGSLTNKRAIGKPSGIF